MSQFQKKIPVKWYKGKVIKKIHNFAINDVWLEFMDNTILSINSVDSIYGIPIVNVEQQ